MNIRKMLVLSALLGSVVFGAYAQPSWWPFGNTGNQENNEDIVELGWDDLIPDDFIQPENPFATMSQEAIDKLLDGSEASKAELARLEEAFYFAPVVDDLDGKRVKIPAYITPLDFDNQTRLSEFLLVPYLGACMHSPPPPANQIVHANTGDAIEMENLYDPIWAIGTLRTEAVESNLATSGYRIEVEKLVPYTTE